MCEVWLAVSLPPLGFGDRTAFGAVRTFSIGAH
jgi:hypothetical protein